MILADQGADVIKVENPDGGDHTRAANNRRNDLSASFLNNNRNKRSLALDLKLPEAKAALLKLGGNDAKMKDMVASLSDEALQPFAEGMVSALVTKGIKPGQCKAIERATRLLSPLPPENTAEIVTFILVLADKPKVRGAVGASKKSDLPICPA
jgi:hypothetical protein